MTRPGSPHRPRAGRAGLIALLLAAAVAGSGAGPAHATFPGTNGLIAFQREAPAGDHTQTDVLTVAPDGTGPIRLTRTPDRNEFGPAWNARGTRIAFWRMPAPFGTGSLWVMDADGSDPRRLTAGIDARDPAWNPGGTRLVYTRDVDDLFTLRASDGLDRRPLTHGRAFDFEPAWSPDGGSVAFTRGFATGDTGDIYVLDLRTEEPAQVTDTPAYDHQVGWAPDGARLVFERDFIQSSAIVAADPDGSDTERLTTGPHFDVGPAYSPDGRRIAFGSDRGDLLGDLWVMRADGGNQHSLLSLPFAEGFPDWQPVAP